MLQELDQTRFTALETCFEAIVPNGPGSISGAEGETKLPYGSPRWFDIYAVDDRELPGTAEAQSVHGKWKCWNPNQEQPDMQCGALRSFITSPKTCNLDLGVPAFAKYLKMLYYSHNTFILVKHLVLYQDSKSLKVRQNDYTLLSHREQELMVNINGEKRLLTGDFTGLQKIKINSIKDMSS